MEKGYDYLRKARVVEPKNKAIAPEIASFESALFSVYSGVDAQSDKGQASGHGAMVAVH